MSKILTDGTAGKDAENSIHVLRREVVDNRTDPETVKQAAEGDDKAFSCLFMQTYRYVYTIVKAYLNNDEDIYDAIQDTYTKAYTNISRLRSFDSFNAWISKIAENSSKDIIAKNGAPKSELDAETEECLDSESELYSSKQEVSMDVTAVFAELSATDAELLTYIYYDGFTVTEVARMQGVPATTVYSRLSAAKRRLKELLRVRGIEKPIYGGDLITLITTTIRNMIGTDLLSAAVAEEILQSVLGKSSKSAVVISKMVRKQRNAAVLRIASLIVMLVVLTSVLTAGIYFSVKSINERVTANDGITAGTSTEIGGTEQADGSLLGDVSSFAQNPDNGSSNGGSSQYGNSDNGSSESGGGFVPSHSSASGTAGSGSQQSPAGSNTSEGTSGEISGTDEPNTGGTGGNITSSSNTSSSNGSSTEDGFVPDCDPAQYNIVGNSCNNMGTGVYGRIARQGEWIYYFGGGIKKVKEDGTQAKTLLGPPADGHSERSYLNVVGEWIYYIEGEKTLYRIKTDGTCGEQLRTFGSTAIPYAVNGYLYVAVYGENRIYQADIDTLEWEVVFEARTEGAQMPYLYFMEDGKTLYYHYRESNVYKYDMKTGVKSDTGVEVTGGFSSTLEFYIGYMAYGQKLYKLDIPAVAVTPETPSSASSFRLEYGYTYKGGVIVVSYSVEKDDGSGGYEKFYELQYLSGKKETVPAVFDGYLTTTHSFPNDDHIYYLDSYVLYRALPDGSEITQLG